MDRVIAARAKLTVASISLAAVARAMVAGTIRCAPETLRERVENYDAADKELNAAYEAL